MGKRELLLTAAFLFVGLVVYQIAAPAGPARGGGFSLSRMMEHLRREVRANSAEAELATETIIPLARAVELRVQSVARLTISGEDRRDIATRLQVHSTGVDEADAKALAGRTVLEVDESGAVVLLKVNYPREGRQRSELTLRIPKSLAVRLENMSGRADLNDVSSLFLNGTRGEVNVTKVAGELRGMFHGGRLRVEGAAGAVKLTARRAEIEIDRVTGDAAFDLSGGSLRVTSILGGLELDSNRVDVEIDDVGGTVRVNAAEGAVALSGVKREARLDGRGTEMLIELARPVAVTAFTTDETLTLRLPPGGLTIDATAAAGNIRVPEALLTVQGDEEERRARGAIRGGGPSVSLRVTRGDIVIK